MKKLVLILLSVVFAVISYGQNVDLVTVDFKFDVNKNLTYYRYIGTANDTIGIVDSTWAKTFSVANRYDALKQVVRVKVDEVAGTGNIPFVWQGKNFNSDAWTTITTVTYKGGGSDTTFFFDQSTAKPYRFYRIFGDVVGTTAQKLQMLDLEVTLYK